MAAWRSTIPLNTPRLKPLLGQLGEEAFDGVEPRGRGRGEMECPARMIGEPFEDVGLFVGGIVVDDGVDDFSGRHGALDGLEEANELLVAMPSHAASDHGSVEDIERGEQRGRAVALVVMGHRPAFSGLERQARLRAVERLDLALLVDRDDHRVLGRVHVEADDVLDLLGELGIVGALKVRMRCGCSRCACHKRCTARRLTPTALAMARPVQCVAWPSGSEQVRSITLATTLAESGARPGLRVLSRSRPSTPCSAYRACQRQTAGRLTLARRATSGTGKRSAE